MKTFTRVQAWRTARASLAGKKSTLGFVPTMGALHKGHLSLVERSVKENDYTLVSLFVNPTQFNNKEDFEKYPNSLEEDLKLLDRAGVDFTLCPPAAEMYADDYRYKVTENQISRILCGAFRPGHFDGVLTVVMKLLGLAQAQRCYMGEKDYQQLMLIREMAENFFLPVEIIPCPTVREKSGLAMSSRNTRLSTEGRERAALIYKTLRAADNSVAAQDQLLDLGFKVEYVEEYWGRRFAAAWLENVRLIDNVQI